MNEPANYIIAACLPTLRPILIRIFPSSFFVLSRKRGLKLYTSSPKVFWPRPSLAPKFHPGSSKHQTHTLSTGPWNTNVHKWEADGGEGYWTDIEGANPNSGSDPQALVLGDRTTTYEGRRITVTRTDDVRVLEDS